MNDPLAAVPVKFEFHVSRQVRERYRFDLELFSITGNVVLGNMAASRLFADRINRERDAEHHPERAISPASLNAMGLIDEILHAVFAQYREQRDPRSLLDALGWFEGRLGTEGFNKTLLAFVEEFPPLAVYRGELTAAEWLRASTGETPHRAVALEELTLLWLANANPAFRPFAELFEDERLAKSTAYRRLTAGLRDYFETRARFGPENQNLIDMLRAPALASPDSLEGQIAFIRERWGVLLADLLVRLLVALDVIKEEQFAVWLRFHPPVHGMGMAPSLGDSSAAAVPHFHDREVEYERFSEDLDWMPRTVMIAKSTYVWLDQLAKTYGREVRTLNQVPDEELNALARRGFNALWLIGVWERSRASQQIKRLTGNPEAAASAYSLYEYTIAHDLGGESAYMNLRDRASARGIRLASDMVPNHMGIDSRWVIEHPEWFVQSPNSPFPAYNFEGPDLSRDGRVEIKIDDHYYDRSDAAVVFRRRDHWTGNTRFLYHGNDGTSFPWNDTAQLNYLKAEVREAVVQTILHVARLFPIIRFDAAMTLTKQHYQRLWFPVPGTGGAIPSRAEHGMTKEQFDALMPQEFWRELVDRVAAEVPGTLLLAEAFWLLEGYFVRTLGMHRVYNSAFMNMLRDEENANYRSVIKNTLEFDPEVLKRYVNFMNNPDERTAVDQFGKGDKYFGVATLLATFPGLPMFGHGQVEGFTERYGMEYRRAYHDETPDPWMVSRHEREIAPLLHRRRLFAEVRDFLLYDFYTDEGQVNEDVFAFSNRRGGERALVVYQNRYAETSGWIRISCSYSEKTPDGGKQLRQRTLSEALGLSSDPTHFVACRDSVTGLEYLYSASQMSEQGLRLELHAYQHSAFLDWRDLRDDASHPWGELCRMLNGRGVASLDDAFHDLRLKPVHEGLRDVLDAEIVGLIAGAPAQAAAAPDTLRRGGVETGVPDALRRGGVEIDAALAPMLEGMRRLLTAVDAVATGDDYGQLRVTRRNERPGDVDSAMAGFIRHIEAARRLPEVERLFSHPWPEEARAVLPSAHPKEQETGEPKRAGAIWGTVLAWAALGAVGSLLRPGAPEMGAFNAFESLRLRLPLAEAFRELGWTGEERWRAAARVRASFAHPAVSDGAGRVPPSAGESFAWIKDPDIAWLLGVHRYQEEQYFYKEPFERLLWWLLLPSLLRLAGAPEADREAVARLERHLEKSQWAAAVAGYRVEALLSLPGRSPKE